MNFNKILIIMVIVVVAFTAVNIFMTLSNRLQVETVSYDSEYEYDAEGTVIMRSIMLLKFDKPSQIERFLDQFDKDKETKISEFQQSVDQISKDLPRSMVVSDFASTATQITSNRVEVEEYSVINGFASVENGQINTSIGDLNIDLQDDSKLTLLLPPNSETLSVDPEPTYSPQSNIFIWEGTGEIRFPEVIFTVEGG
ncbi:MAG: DUF4897 domain-containing protein [Thermotogota bacterium]|nr:DUF4897 domain-containing protein [Thermotogota bacterium]